MDVGELSSKSRYVLLQTYELLSSILNGNLQWTGYNSMTYELPVDTYDGRVELQTVARRIARACVHFLQVSMRPRHSAATPPRVSQNTSLTPTIRADEHDPRLLGSCDPLPPRGVVPGNVAACALVELSDSALPSPCPLTVHTLSSLLPDLTSTPT